MDNDHSRKSEGPSLLTAAFYSVWLFRNHLSHDLTFSKRFWCKKKCWQGPRSSITGSEAKKVGVARQGLLSLVGTPMFVAHWRRREGPRDLGWQVRTHCCALEMPPVLGPVAAGSPLCRCLLEGMCKEGLWGVQLAERKTKGSGM